MPSLALTLRGWEFKGATFVDGHRRGEAQALGHGSSSGRTAPRARTQTRARGASTRSALRLRGLRRSPFPYASGERSAAVQGGAATGLDVGQGLHRKGEKHGRWRRLRRCHWLKIVKVPDGSSQWEAFIFTSDSSVLFEFLYQTYRVFHRDTWQG